MVSFTVTRRALSYGTSPDTITGWPPRTYTESSIKMAIAEKGASPFGGFGYYSIYPFTGYTSDLVEDGDEIYYPLMNAYYTVKNHRPNNAGSNFDHYVCELEKRDFENPAASSGTWHLDDDSVGTDSRNRMKVLLDLYLPSCSIYLDDGATVAVGHVLFFDKDLWLLKLFKNLAYDYFFAVEKLSTKPRFTCDHYTYAFEETVTLHIYAANKTGLTATNLIEQVEKAIREIFTTYPIGAYGSIRTITNITYQETGIKGLYHAATTIQYLQANSDYTATYPTITWGPSATATGTFVFPNIIDRKLTMLSNNKHLTVPGRLGQWTQKLGLPDLQIDLVGDLDVGDWKRPQGSTSKTDVKDWQVFADIQFNGELSGQTYQTLNLGFGGSIQVTTEEVHVNEQNHTVSLRFYGYNVASATAYKSWFSINP